MAALLKLRHLFAIAMAFLAQPAVAQEIPVSDINEIHSSYTDCRHVTAGKKADAEMLVSLGWVESQSNSDSTPDGKRRFSHPDRAQKIRFEDLNAKSMCIVFARVADHNSVDALLNALEGENRRMNGADAIFFMDGDHRVILQSDWSTSEPNVQIVIFTPEKE